MQRKFVFRQLEKSVHFIAHSYSSPVAHRKEFGEESDEQYGDSVVIQKEENDNFFFSVLVLQFSDFH